MKIIDMFRRHLNEKKALISFQFHKAGFQYFLELDGFSEVTFDSKNAVEACSFSGNGYRAKIYEAENGSIIEFSDPSGRIDKAFCILSVAYCGDDDEPILGTMVVDIGCENFDDELKAIMDEFDDSFCLISALERYKGLDIIYSNFG